MSDASGDIRDSTGTQNGIQSGLPLNKQQGIGTMGNSIFLDGSDNTYFNITNLTYKFNTENIILEVWAKFPENQGYYDYVVYFGDTDILPSVDMIKYPNAGVNNGKLFALNYIDGGSHNIAWAETSHINQWIFFLFNVSFDITDIIE
jgi:hypothetical protein